MQNYAIIKKIHEHSLFSPFVELARQQPKFNLVTSYM